MASVPSAGCLTAKNQFYRVRQNSESSVGSVSSSDSGLSTDQEKSNHDLPEIFEKCWWLKTFFYCEQVPSPSVRINMSTNSSGNAA
ncbi:pancreatic progenitor cell differentiation and proliferation factor-like protein [Spea bombifrons]|uniref:pancreatic progenitor cell differentiation and proliferation factor-like protein n=1 Tax=Spea bombifrons TaxID=233779 RepID=UPI00234A64FB|nr:pancreatic progenitor cell differentiation and proliferation factor-like protein [Spea bombifrons]